MRGRCGVGLADERLVGHWQRVGAGAGGSVSDRADGWTLGAEMMGTSPLGGGLPGLDANKSCVEGRRASIRACAVAVVGRGRSAMGAMDRAGRRLSETVLLRRLVGLGCTRHTAPSPSRRPRSPRSVRVRGPARRCLSSNPQPIKSPASPPPLPPPARASPHALPRCHLVRPPVPFSSAGPPPLSERHAPTTKHAPIYTAMAAASLAACSSSPLCTMSAPPLSPSSASSLSAPPQDQKPVFALARLHGDVCLVQGASASHPRSRAPP